MLSFKKRASFLIYCLKVSFDGAALVVVGCRTAGNQSKRDSKEQQETTLPAEIHCSDFPKEEI